MQHAVDGNQFGCDSLESANGFVGLTKAVPKSRFLKSNIQSSRSKRVEIDVEPTGEKLTAGKGDQIQQNQKEIFSTENTSCSMTLVNTRTNDHFPIFHYPLMHKLLVVFSLLLSMNNSRLHPKLCTVCKIM